MSRTIRRLFVVTVALAVLVLVAMAGIRLRGEHRLAEIEAHFVQEVGPLPDFDGLTQEESDGQSQARAEKSLAALKAGRIAGDAALEALGRGDRVEALEHLERVVSVRDDLLSRHELVSQLVGIALGREILEITEAYLTPEISSAETQELVGYLDMPATDGWNAMLAGETARMKHWTRPPEANWAERLYLLVNRPRLEAATTAMYLAMHRAVRDRVDEPYDYIHEAYRDARAGTVMDPGAEFLIPSLVSMVEKRQAYLDDLKRLQARLAQTQETSNSA